MTDRLLRCLAHLLIPQANYLTPRWCQGEAEARQTPARDHSLVEKDKLSNEPDSRQSHGRRGPEGSGNQEGGLSREGPGGLLRGSGLSLGHLIHMLPLATIPVLGGSPTLVCVTVPGAFWAPAPGIQIQEFCGGPGLCRLNWLKGEPGASGL